MAVVRTLIGNVRGPQGEDGSSFEFKKTYATIAAMNSDFSGTDTQTGDYVLISAASINDADNGKMYRKGNSAWIYVAKITGPAGATGPAGPLCPLDTSMAVTVPGQAALDAALGPTLAGKLDATGDSANNTVTYTSDDVADGSASAWETVQPLTSEEKHESLFAKISKVIKNVRFLYKLLGTTDISGIGSGTVTDILSALHSGKFDKANVVNNLTTTTAGYALDAREGKTLADNVSTLNDALVNTTIQSYTPELVRTNGTTVIGQDTTGGSRTGRYIKIGNKVFVYATIKTRITESGEYCGITLPYHAIISKIPFTVAELTQNFQSEAGHINTGNVSSTVTIATIMGTTGTSAVRTAAMESGTYAYITFSGWYLTDQ